MLLNIVSGNLGHPVATKGAKKVATKDATKGAKKVATKETKKGGKKGTKKVKKKGEDRDCSYFSFFYCSIVLPIKCCNYIST